MRNYIPQIVQKIAPRSNFNLSETNTLPLAVGPLYPVLHRRVYPRDSFEITPSIEIRSNPLQTDFMGTFRVHLETFFEPLHNLYGAFDNNHQISSDMHLWTNALVISNPTAAALSTCAFYGKVGNNSLINLLLFPFNTQLDALPRSPQGSSTIYQFNIEPIFAYIDIIRTYYQNELAGGIAFYGIDFVNGESTPVTAASLDQFMLNLRKFIVGQLISSSTKDSIFVGTQMSAWASAIFQNEASQLADISKQQLPMSGLALRPYARDIFSTLMAGTNYQSVFAQTTASGQLTITSLKSAIKMEQYEAVHDFSNGRFADFVEALFGTHSKPRTDRPELVDVQSFYIDVNTIKTTSASEGQPAGSSIGSILQGYNGRRFYFRSDSMHGHLMSILSISPVFSYSEGLALGSLKKSFSDLYNPKLDGLPPMPLSSLHFNCQTEDGGFPVDGNGALGYAPAFIEDMTSINHTYGDFSRTGSLAAWSSTRRTKVLSDGGNTAELSKDHYVRPDDWNYIFADESTGAQNFYASIHFEISAKRAKSKLLTDEI